MKIKVITESSQESLETKVNKYIKDKEVIRIQVKPVIVEKAINTLSTYEKQEIYVNEYMATIIHEG